MTYIANQYELEATLTVIGFLPVLAVLAAFTLPTRRLIRLRKKRQYLLLELLM
jgi:hypothetical protein